MGKLRGLQCSSLRKKSESKRQQIGLEKKTPSQKEGMWAGPSYPVSRMLLMVDNKTRRKSGSVDGSMQQGESEFHLRAAQSAGDHFGRALFTQALKSCFFFQHAPIWCELRVQLSLAEGRLCREQKLSPVDYNQLYSSPMLLNYLSKICVLNKRALCAEWDMLPPPICIFVPLAYPTDQPAKIDPFLSTFSLYDKNFDASDKKCIVALLSLR